MSGQICVLLEKFMMSDVARPPACCLYYRNRAHARVRAAARSRALEEVDRVVQRYGRASDTTDMVIGMPPHASPDGPRARERASMSDVDRETERERSDHVDVVCLGLCGCALSHVGFRRNFGVRLPEHLRHEDHNSLRAEVGPFDVLGERQQDLQLVHDLRRVALT